MEEFSFPHRQCRGGESVDEIEQERQTSPGFLGGAPMPWEGESQGTKNKTGA